MILTRSTGSKILLPRAYRCNYDAYSSQRYCYYSPWDSWGRWLFLAVVVGFVLLMFLASCLSARRRRNRGLSPFRGTGWLAGKPPPGHGPAVYTGGQQGDQQGPYPQFTGNTAAPPYNAPPNDSYQTGHTGANAGYYGPQQGGIELQTPPNTYQPQQGGEPVYAPPPGPPPAHVK
ncbi:MAG: hypothetical protein M1816_007196 [Peltula sp. TS41687]|nr:MAG: hypothetical protein M1816_007196 [Peltula sp. TS41687]